MSTPSSYTYNDWAQRVGDGDLQVRINEAARRLARDVGGTDVNADALVAVADLADQVRLAPVGKLDEVAIAHQVQAALTKYPDLGQHRQANEQRVNDVLAAARSYGMKVMGDA